MRLTETQANGISLTCASRIGHCLVVAALVSVSLLVGCDQYESQGVDPHETQQPDPGDADTQGRSSTLGQALDAGERTRDRMDDYHQRVLEEAERIDQP